MELHPILEAEDVPNHGVWYVLSARGEPPSMRVGHTCVFVPGKEDSGSKLLIIGGANPSGSFAETYSLDFDQYEWDIPQWKSLQARYEHTAWLTNNSIYVFGGAMMSGNLNTIQKLDLGTDVWTTPGVSGTAPSARTCHTHAAADGMMYVFSGGETGAEPVTDRQVHVFDTNTLTWSQPKTNGKPPKARHGHVMVVVGSKLFIHGGMSRNTFFDDLHELQLKTMTWKVIRCKGDVPSGRAAHSAVAYGKHIIISCGMNHNGAMDDLYSFNTETSRWTKLIIEGPPPSCRLDHSMCLIEWKYKEKKEDTESEHSITNQIKSDVEINPLQIQELTLGDGNIKEHSVRPEVDTNSSVSPDGSSDPGATAEHLVTECAAVSSGEDIAATKKDPAAETTSATSSNAIIVNANDSNTSELTIDGAAGGEAISDRTASGLDMVEEGSCMLLLMYGGMDTQGEIFDDTLVLKINLPT